METPICTLQEWEQGVRQQAADCNTALESCQGASKGQPISWSAPVQGGTLVYSRMVGYCNGLLVYEDTMFCIILDDDD